MTVTATMTEALRLTRAGRLTEAATLLRGDAPAATGPFVLTPQSRTATPRSAAAQLAQPLTGTARTNKPRPATPAAAGSFRAHVHKGAHGTLGYKLYVPANATPGLPLLVMLHGCTQSPDDFARGTGMNALADARGFIVAYPGQTRAANPQKCWNWFRPGDQGADAGEPALIAGLTRAVIVAQAVDPARVFVAGLSAGGAAAAIMAGAYPDLYAGVGVHSGLGCGTAHDVPSAMQAMRRGGRVRGGAAFVPLIVVHGDRDTTVAEANASALVAAARAAHDGALTATTERGQSAGGRAWTRTRDRDTGGRVRIEHWAVAGAGHAWAGGSPAGSYTDPAGPDASTAMLDFFLNISR